MRMPIHISAHGVRPFRAVLLACSLVAALAPTQAFALAQSASLSLDGALSGQPGDTVDVVVSLGSLVNVSELHAFKFAVSYDPDVLVPIEAVPGAVLSAWPAVDFDASVTEMGFTMVGLTNPAIAVGAGPLLTLRFEIVAGAFEGAVSPLRIVGSQPGQPAVLLDTPNAPETGIKVATSGGSIAVIGGAPCFAGDANVDGSVDVADAVLVLRALVDLATLSGQAECNADAIRDNVIDVGDVVRILRTVVGLPKAAPASAATVRLEQDAQGARLVIEPATGIHGVQALLRTGDGASIGALAPASHGLRLAASRGDQTKIAWASADELAAGASVLVIELPVAGDGVVAVGSVRAFDAQGSAVELRVEGENVPSGDRVGAVKLGNQPNPFNPSTQIRFELPQRAVVKVELFNAKGQRVRVLVDAEMSEGLHAVTWNGTDDLGRSVASGVYFARLSSAVGSAQHRLLMLK